MDHQQICEFVNSKDIRKHLKDIGYEFSTPQAAWLVHRCQRLTMEERHRAWREIIRDMPDCAMEERLNMKRIDSFHDFLKDYIELEKRGVQDFMSAGSCVYHYEYHEPGREDWCGGGAYFSDYQHCIEFYKRWDGDDSGIDRVRIWKYCLAAPDSDRIRKRLLTLTPDLEILTLDSCVLLDDDYDLDGAFDGMCFDFPVPFSRGDILVDCINIQYAQYAKPFVLSYISTWNSEKMLSSGFGESDCPSRRGWEHFDKVTERILRSGDYTDGGAIGTAIDERGGSFDWDHFIETTDLEYYRGPLKGLERQLKALSCYEKGEISGSDLANLCCAIRMESIAKEGLWNFRNEFLESIGICPEDGEPPVS